MIDNRAVDLKEERIRLEREGLSMVPTNLSSKSQWTNKSNTSYMNNSAQRNVTNTAEDYQQFQINIDDGENHVRTNLLSVKTDSLSTPSCDSILTPPNCSLTANSGQSVLRLDQTLQGIHTFNIVVIY